MVQQTNGYIWKHMNFVLDMRPKSYIGEIRNSSFFRKEPENKSVWTKPKADSIEL